MRATDVMLAGKVAVSMGYGDRQGLPPSLRGGLQGPGHGDRPSALQATMEGHEVVVLEDVGEPLFSTTGNKDVITAKHMASMKHNAIVGNIGHFDEIDMAGLGKIDGVEQIFVKDQVNGSSRTAIPSSFSPRSSRISSATGHPSFVMSAPSRIRCSPRWSSMPITRSMRLA